MSYGRNRLPSVPVKGFSPRIALPPPLHEPPPHFGRNLGPGPVPLPVPPPHPAALLDEIRDPRRLPPPHPALFEDHLAAQHQDIQALLAENQGLAATHVALKQELEAAQHELQRMSHIADSLCAEKDAQVRDLHDKTLRLEVDLRALENMQTDLRLVRADIKDLSDVRQDLTGRVQMMTRDLERYNADLQQVPALKLEIGSMNQELQRARSAIEYEKKGYAENYEHGLVMEKKLIAMARELEKLRAEIANADKRARPPASVANPGPAYNMNHGNPEAGYAANPYPASYGMNQMQANTDNFPQYGGGPGSWGAYDIQRAQGLR